VGDKDAYVFDWTSIIANLKELLSDQMLMDQCDKGDLEFLLHSAPPVGDDEAISQMNQGKWWRRTEDKFCKGDPKTILGVVNFFIDGTHCDEHGNIKLVPVIMTSGNFPKELNRKSEYMRCLAYLPSGSEFSSADKQTVAESKVLLGLKHACLAAMFEEIVGEEEERSFLVIIKGELYRVIPVVSFIINDTAEANELTLHYSTTDVECPCRYCLVSKANRHLPMVGEPRLSEDMKNLVQKAKAILDKHVKGARDGSTAAKEMLKRVSLQGLDNAFWDVFFGDTEGRGIYSALPIEVLHQLEKGLMKYWHECVIEEVRKRGGDELVSKLDSRARELYPFLCHQSERGIKTKSFPRGVSDIPKLSAQEMPAVLLMIMACLGDDGEFLEKTTARRWTSLAWELLVIRDILMAEDWTKQMRTTFRARVTSVMTNFRAVVGEARNPGNSAAGVGFPKFHLLMHYADFLEEYGPPIIAYSGFGEKGHQTFAKKPTHRTQRRTDSIVAQVIKRLHFVHAFEWTFAMAREHFRKWHPTTSPASIYSRPSRRNELLGHSVEVVVAARRNSSMHKGALKVICDWANRQNPAPVLVTVFFTLKTSMPEAHLTADLLFRADPHYKYGTKKHAWLDFAEVQYENDKLCFAECHGFFKHAGLFYVVVQELRPLTQLSSTAGPFRDGYAFTKHERVEVKKRVHEDGEETLKKTLKFDVFETAAINNTAFLFPAHFSGNGGRSKSFFSVPQNEQWYL
jgi:hypothetical protein